MSSTYNDGGLQSLDSGGIESSATAVSWASIISGAFVAASASIIMLALGSGLGLASISPWSNSGASATTFTIMTGIWLIVVHWIASGMGGYITGRLRTKWVGVHTHEVMFRDTAHGLLTWAVATVIGAAIAGSAASSLVSGGVKAATTVVSGAAQAAMAGQGSSGSTVGMYELDTLFRSPGREANAATNAAREETATILARGVATGNVPEADRTYLAEIVAARTGISQADAKQRVDNTISQVKAAEEKARQVADTARKAASAVSFFTALAMLIGAFIACAASTLGGKRRDEHA